MGERWRPIPGFGGHYEASDRGHIRSMPRVVKKMNRWGKQIEQRYAMRVLSEFKGRDGHLSVRFGVDGVKYTKPVHRLVALAFHGPPAPGLECCHGNGKPADNRPENLRWDTHAANNADRKAHGNYATGTAHHAAKFDAGLIAAILAGKMSRAEAIRCGVSATHFYRLRKQTEEWFQNSYGVQSEKREAAND